MGPLGALMLAAFLARVTGAIHQRGLGPTGTDDDEGDDRRVGVFVMLPLDVVSENRALRDPKALEQQLNRLVVAGVDGFAVDVWWGLTEVRPGKYDFGPYLKLVHMAAVRGLKVQLVASFHQCGGNVNDDCDIPLPDFVLNDKNQNIWFRDRLNNANLEYISFFADKVELDDGRTPLGMYSDWFGALGQSFKAFFDAGTVVEVQVGLGPSGQLRYPSYSAPHGWKYPGVGEFQVYDKYARQSWLDKSPGDGSWPDPPADAGPILYNSRPWDTLFFTQGYYSAYGKLFLGWYFAGLLRHGEAVLAEARRALPGRRLAMKVAGVHWYYGHASHAAELTAGYYNIDDEVADPYRTIAFMATRYNVTLTLTCLEMRDGQEPEKNAVNRPEKLVQQLIQASRDAGVELHGENALPFDDATSYNQVLKVKRELTEFTFLRLSDKLLHGETFSRFCDFVARMVSGRGPVGGQHMRIEEG